jgi:PKD repeat protein
MYAPDPLGRAFYQGIYPHSIEQLQRQPDGRLADFATPYISDSSVIRAVAADPSGRTLAVSGESNVLSTYAIAADGSLSASRATTMTTAARTYWNLSYAPLQPPVAALSSSVSTAGVVTFDASTSHGTALIARYDWKFGDGTALADGGPAPTHVYPETGDYTATLTVTDSLGCSVTGTFGGMQSYCAGSPVAAATQSVHIAAQAAPAPARAVQPGQATATATETATATATETATETETARPLAAAATPNARGTKVLLTWAKPAGGEPAHYLIAWSTLHSAQGPGDPNMRHLRVEKKTNIAMRVQPRTTIHFAVYALAADGHYTRATKTTVRLPR